MSHTVLFVHTNFPAQFRHLARALAAEPQYKVFAFGSDTARAIEGVTLIRYKPDLSAGASVHPFAARFDLECVRAEQILYLANRLRAGGVEPDVIFVHPGWGEALPLRVVFPHAKICVYCEMFYRPRDSDVDFDPEFPRFGLDGLVKTSTLNASSLLALNDADVGLSPTNWQKSTYPTFWRPKIRVVHEGVDCDEVKPEANVEFKIADSAHPFRKGDEIVTYVARNLEPYRGIHTFVRALPLILSRRPNARILVVGGAGVSYGMSPPDGTTWIEFFLNQIRGRCDLSRVHLLGPLERPHYLKVLQISSAHVYLTYPFVLSWSMIESMAAGCAIVASRTPPVEEVIEHGRSGLLFDFFSPEDLASSVCDLLARPEQARALRDVARAVATQQFDLKTVSLPRHRALLDELIGGSR